MKKRIKEFALASIVVSSASLILTTAVYADLGDTTLKKGMNHPDIAVLQEKLHMLGYFENDKYTTYFGDKTYAALKSFQAAEGLNPDGIAGPKTLELIKVKARQQEILPKDFQPVKEGDSDDNVVDIQKKLKDLGIYNTEITSVYDQATVEAVISFQKSKGLPETGIVDTATIIELNTAFNSKIAERASASRRLAAAKAVDFAKQFLGMPYVWGASSEKAFDCSGFTVYIMKKFNVDLPRRASEQFKAGIAVKKEDLQPGDLVFFTTYKPGPSHVGIYIGDNKFIHASSGSRKVTITDLNDKYYNTRYLGARRFNLTDNEKE